MLSPCSKARARGMRSFFERIVAQIEAGLEPLFPANPLKVARAFLRRAQVARECPDRNAFGQLRPDPNHPGSRSGGAQGGRLSLPMTPVGARGRCRGDDRSAAAPA